MAKSRKQKEKAKHRTGLLKSLSGPHSENQKAKREKFHSEREVFMRNLKVRIGLV